MPYPTIVNRPVAVRRLLGAPAALPPVPWQYFADGAGRQRLIDLVDAAGLRGRGGAGFPTARKMRAVASGRKQAVIVANGCEGEPASQKDHVLLSMAPHLVLDGIALAAHAVGATEAVLCVHHGDPIAGGVAVALAQRPNDPVPVRVAEVPRRYVASEASALVNFLNTGDARPTAKPPRASERGVHARPTLVDNVETLAQITIIARIGAERFREFGTPELPGTMLVTLGGAVRRPGVYEISCGASLGDLLRLAGGAAEPLQAVLSGGYGGTWLPLPAADDLPLPHDAFRNAGAALGVGLLLAMPMSGCGVAETSRILSYLAGESAKQCGPCMFGLPAIAADFAAIAGGGTAGVLDRLHRRLGVIPGRGACAHPDGAVRLAASALRVFGEDVAAHATGRGCLSTWSWQTRTA